MMGAGEPMGIVRGVTSAIMGAMKSTWRDVTGGAGCPLANAVRGVCCGGGCGPWPFVWLS
jgi:hypothetical protein